MDIISRCLFNIGEIKQRLINLSNLIYPMWRGKEDISFLYDNVVGSGNVVVSLIHNSLGIRKTTTFFSRNSTGVLACCRLLSYDARSLNAGEQHDRES